MARRVTDDNVEKVFDGIKYVLFDCDGTLWNGDHVFDGIPAALRHLRALGYQIRFITNNAAATRHDMVAASFSKLDCGVTPDEVVTCAYATALALRANASDPEKGFDKGNVFVLGQPQLHAELQTALAPGRYTYGLEMRNDNGPNVVTTQRPYDMRLIANAWEHRTLPAPQLLRTETQQTISLQELDIGAVVIGPDFCFSPATLALATMLLQRHKLLQSQSKAFFVATNDDATITYGKIGWNFPSTGSFLASLVAASGRQPDICCGKPSKDLFDLLQSEERAHGNEVTPEECIMVGDRLTTDIMFGRRAGTRTLFVLTGVEHECEIPSPETAAKDPVAAQRVPDYVGESVASVVLLLRRPVLHPQ
jgi:4-nitrophenyl phosphatase